MMNYLRRFTLMLVLVGWAGHSAYATVPPSTSLESSPGGMSPMDWFLYGSVVIALCGLAVAAVVLIAWLIRELFWGQHTTR